MFPLHMKNTLQIYINEPENLFSMQGLKCSTPVSVDKWKSISIYYHQPWDQLWGGITIEQGEKPHKGEEYNHL